LTEPPVRPTSGLVQAVEPGSLAAALGLQPGDELLGVNGHPVEDVIDVQFYAAEDDVELRFLRAGQERAARGPRAAGQPLGLEFAHPTFDVDIRRCNNLCPFCFVLQTAPRMRRTLYIKDDDYRYSFLYGHFVTLTNLAPRDWERIEEQRLSPLYVSVHSTDLENRRRVLANPRAPDVLGQLRWLAERGIQTHTQLVITPGLNDGAFMERSVRDLAALYPAVQTVSVVPVGLTRHHKYGHRPHTRAEAEAVLDAVAAWQRGFLAALGARFVYPTDEWFLVTGRPIPPRRYYAGLALEENGLGMVRAFLDDWQRVKREIRSHSLPLTLDSSLFTPHASRLTLVTATLFAPTLASVAAEFNRLAGADLRVLPVPNERLGRTITVAGLLMAEDVIAALNAQPETAGGVVVLPRVMFDHPQGISLDDISPLQVAQRTGRTVFLADAMGDVLDTLTGRSALRFDPGQAAIPVETMRAGGWAVEKYL
jgi:putative radical SAM enzyme (TIGR03279 family)